MSTSRSTATRVLFGFHAVSARLSRQPASVVELYLARERHDPRMQEALALAQTHAVKIIHADPQRLDGLSGHGNHQGIVAIVTAPPQHVVLEEVLEDLQEPPLLLVLDGITDPHNLGACLRVADAMGVHAVIAPKDKSVGINATVAKVACGAAEVVPYIVVTNLARTLREIKDAGIWVAGTDMQAETDLFHFDQCGPLAWVMGAEGEGMRRLTREHCDVLVRIPMFGVVESLNVSVASGICIAESRRQRVMKVARPDQGS